MQNFAPNVLCTILQRGIHSEGLGKSLDFCYAWSKVTFHGLRINSTALNISDVFLISIE